MKRYVTSSSLIKGKTYSCYDGVVFTIKKMKNGVVTILDKNDNKLYDIEVAEIELMNPKEIDKM